MKEIVVLSGKGGTGKTSIVGSFASLAKNKVLVDCDVDAADLHLLLQPSIRQRNDFWSGHTAVIDSMLCTRCGLCEEICRFDAIHDLVVNQAACEGCGFCRHICPVGAITMNPDLSGEWFISETKYGQLVHARLGIACENSGKLVTTVRKHAKTLAQDKGVDYIISDGPPGIGCPVISALSGTDVALLVTEPTLSGMNDLERIISVCQHFGIPALVCINKYDINEDNSRKIKEFCLNQGVKVVAEIPFDNIFTEAMKNGSPVVEYSHNETTSQIEKLWETVSAKAKGNG